MHTHISIHTHIYTHATQVYIHTYICIHVYTIQTCTYMCIYMHKPHIYTHHTYVHIHLHIHTHVHIKHTYTHTRYTYTHLILKTVAKSNPEYAISDSHYSIMFYISNLLGTSFSPLGLHTCIKTYFHFSDCGFHSVAISW